MKKFNKAILAAAALGALSLGYASEANASAYAVTQDAITRLTFSAARVSNGNLIGFSSFNFSASTSSQLSTTGADFGGDFHGGSAFSQDRNVNVGAGGANIVDPKHAVQSDGPNVAALGANNFTPAGTGIGNNYSRADHILSDTAVNKAGLASCVGAACGGDFKSVTETFVKAAQLGSPVSGATSAVNSQTWGLAVRIPAGGVDFTIEFDLDLLQVASLVGENGDPGATATANFNLSFQVGAARVNFLSLINANGGIPFVSANETNVLATGTSGVNISFSDAGGVRHYVATFRITTPGAASLLINYGAAASAVSTQPDRPPSIPEPATLGLVGLGLVGLGTLARRRKAA